MAIPYRVQRTFKRLIGAVLVIAIVLAIVLLCWFLWLDRYVVYHRDGGATLDARSSLEIEAQPAKQRPKLPKVSIYYNEGENATVVATDMTRLTGYYITAEDLKQDITVIQSQLDALEPGTPVMIDVKNSRGELFYDSKVSDYRSGAISTTAMGELLEYMRSKDLYTIARMSALKDFNFGLNNVEYGLPTSGGYLWVDPADPEYCYWLNPSSQGTRSYLISLITELKNMGFDEVVMTNFYFPNTTDIVFNGDRADAIADAASVLVNTCATESFTVSFTGNPDFYEQIIML